MFPTSLIKDYFRMLCNGRVYMSTSVRPGRPAHVQPM